MKIEIIETKNIKYFLPLFKELTEFGDRFLLAMLRWCGYGRERYEPLKMWEVYIVFVDDEPAGVSGLYQNLDTPDDVFWIGWLGIRPKFRKLKISNTIMEDIEKRCIDKGATEIRVNTDDWNKVALSLYHKFGYREVGYAFNMNIKGQYDPTDVVLVKKI